MTRLLYSLSAIHRYANKLLLRHEQLHYSRMSYPQYCKTYFQGFFSHKSVSVDDLVDKSTTAE